ncbi:MAG: hypothetical protein ABEI27_09540 [Halobellus sp.]|uniref:hypothetical protein n=1 Tax=Halobellus sp. TaxID=1979212 RepID=UPI0035D4A33A
MTGAAFALVALLFGIGAPLVLYGLVRSEHDQRQTMNRTDAERAARRDTGDDRH